MSMIKSCVLTVHNCLTNTCISLFNTHLLIFCDRDIYAVVSASQLGFTGTSYNVYGFWHQEAEDF